MPMPQQLARKPLILAQLVQLSPTWLVFPLSQPTALLLAVIQYHDFQDKAVPIMSSPADCWGQSEQQSSDLLPQQQRYPLHCVLWRAETVP
mmetsp:Transcript_117297/g.343533  ORF Transcript_117297/g.343533 Transcript_117297/m.343533 type:complete len:91 (-) Transcript_117297:339-611(-)